MCLRRVSLLSRCTPRYITSSAFGSGFLFNKSGGQSCLFSVNVTCLHFFSFTFIRQWETPALISWSVDVAVLHRTANFLSYRYDFRSLCVLSGKAVLTLNIRPYSQTLSNAWDTSRNTTI